MTIFDKKLIMPLLAIVVLVLMIAWMAGAFKEKIEPGVGKAVQVDRSQSIAVMLVEQQRLDPVPASIKAKQSTSISSRILARIEKVYVRAGDNVEKGQLLIELEDSDLQSRVSQSKAQIRSVNARLVEARQALARAVELNDRNLLAQADREKAQANHDSLLASQGNAQQSLREAQASLGFASIHSPINGRIVDRFAEPGDTAQPGVQLLSLYNPLSLRVEANVREKLVLSLTIGQVLQVVIPSRDKQLNAEIEELVPAGNAGSRSFLVKSRLDYSEDLLPGMYAQLMVPAGKERLLVIPGDRVARVGQLDVVWVANKGVSERRFIRSGKLVDDTMIEVVSGLEEGELILPIPP